MHSSRIPQLGLTESAMRNLSAAQATGFSMHRPALREGMHGPHRDGVRKRKIILKLPSRTPSLLQDCASLPALLGLTAESGFKVRSVMGESYGLNFPGIHNRR